MWVTARLVALVTSFSGLFFRMSDAAPGARQAGVAAAMILAGLALGTLAAWGLGRSYDFLPALRGVQTRWVYGVIRHPMYLSSIVIRAGYLIQNPLGWNIAVFGLMVWLYERRSCYEEAIMRNDPRYGDYCSRVRYRFVPRVY